LKVWDINTKNLIKERDTGSEICSIISSQLTNDILTGHGYKSNAICVWRTKNLKRSCKLEHHESRVLSLHLGPESKSFVSVSPDETMCFWSLMEQKTTESSKNSEIFS